jgi:hypothetical protein
MAYLHQTTIEFLSPDFHTAAGKLFMLALLGTLALLALSPHRPTFPRLLLILATVAFALQARRNIALLGAVGIPVLALHFDSMWRALPDRRGIRRVFELGARRATTLPIVGVLCVLFVGLALAHGHVLGLQLVPDRLDRREFPIEAVTWARGKHLRGRLFHDFVWGGYILYAWPEQKVFIDGGADFYGTDLMRTYLETLALEPGWRDTLANREISLVLVPTRSPMVAELSRDGDWQLRYCDATAALLQRDAEQARSGNALARLAACKADLGPDRRAAITAH